MSKALPKIGIDIGAASVKLVELAPVGKKWKMLTAASMPSGEGGIVPGASNLAAYSVAIARVIKEAGIKSKRVVAALPEEQISTHVVEMPMMSDAELDQALQWQVEQYIPIPLDKAVWSYEVVSRNVPGSGGMEVLVVAAAKSLVDAYTSVLEQAGLEVVALESELMATARAELDVATGLAVIVDIGARSTDVGLVRAGQLIFARTIATAGDAFTRAIESTLGLEKSVAEQYKNAYGFSASHLEGKLMDAMKPVLQIIASEIRKTIDFYVAKHVGEAVRVVTLSGGVAALPDVVSILSGLIGLEVEVGNPFGNVILDDVQKKALLGNEPFYAVAVGLAMREV